ncbi:BURP domain-containing protein 3-like [Humulus lupulus]|uniref:BURP domain-containing protein 3-like n=1 Tax=Humulus lupulus TaxID=3486 RepID=UPI002B401936|nr:BURP domain-containing protein 3-like [Humulus lupulus]
MSRQIFSFQKLYAMFYRQKYHWSSSSNKDNNNVKNSSVLKAYHNHNNVFFKQKALHPGQEFTLQFPESKCNAKFLRREVANAIPFSSNKLPEILEEFGIKPESVEAETVERTLLMCDESAIEGETKLCATSPEALIDFGVSILGKNVGVYASEVDKVSNKVEKYTIVKSKNGVKKIADKGVVCHKQNYLYGLFYCHDIGSTKAFLVSLVGSNESRVSKAVALCHYDTRFWNPRHIAFQILNVKPGTVPICHFLPKGHIVWVPNTSI